MPLRTSINVSALIDEKPLTTFTIAIVAFSFFIILWDRYDISAIAFTVPHIVRDWQITDRAVLGPIFSASLIGILFGSPLFGYIGDRLGRKVAIAGSCITFGAFTLGAAAAHSLNQLFWLRALAGFGSWRVAAKSDCAQWRVCSASDASDPHHYHVLWDYAWGCGSGIDLCMVGSNARVAGHL